MECKHIDWVNISFDAAHQLIEKDPSILINKYKSDDNEHFIIEFAIICKHINNLELFIYIIDQVDKLLSDIHYYHAFENEPYLPLHACCQNENYDIFKYYINYLEHKGNLKYIINYFDSIILVKKNKNKKITKLFMKKIIYLGYYECFHNITNNKMIIIFYYCIWI